MAYMLHARTAEPQQQLLLSKTSMQKWNNGIMQPSSSQRLDKHTSAQMENLKLQKF
jgi:hypothetical protein